MAKKPIKPLQTDHERQLEKMLQNAGLSIRYEPKIFRSHGKKKLGFRPDFYLPDLDLYIEIGNLKHKRKKMRMMRGQFPDTRVLFLDNCEMSLFKQVLPVKLAELLECMLEKTVKDGLTLPERKKLAQGFL